MSQNKQLSILEFSRLTGIKRENLRFYDRIGLLRPETRGENKYRYYSRHQLNTAYFINNLRALGVGIEEIKRYSTHRTPQKALALLAQQDANIQAEIRQLREIRLIMRMQSDMIRQALDHNENALLLQKKAAEPLFLCPPIPAQLDGDEGGIFSYEYADAHGVNLQFPMGVMVAQEELEAENTQAEGRYYFKVGSGGNAEKPAGLYAVAYGTCDPWKTEALYWLLLGFIKQQGLRIAGNAYEEYPLGDLAVSDPSQYCVCVEILVERPDSPPEQAP